MNSIWDDCLDFFKSDDAKLHLKTALIEPMGDIMYQEFYFYVWLICFYHIFLIILILSIVVIITKQHFILTSFINSTHNIPPIF